MQAIQGVRKDDSETQIYYTAAPLYQAREMLKEDKSLKWVNILNANTLEFVDRIYQSAVGAGRRIVVGYETRVYQVQRRSCDSQDSDGCPNRSRDNQR